MPKLVVKIEGRGNGIKTNIVNMVDVARVRTSSASASSRVRSMTTYSGPEKTSILPHEVLRL